MGGGTSIWASPDWKKDPREIFNYKLWFLVTTVAFAGFSYGFDHGNVGGVLTLPSFRHTFGLDKMSAAASAARQGDIASMSEWISSAHGQSPRASASSWRPTNIF